MSRKYWEHIIWVLPTHQSNTVRVGLTTSAATTLTLNDPYSEGVSIDVVLPTVPQAILAGKIFAAISVVSNGFSGEAGYVDLTLPIDGVVAKVNDALTGPNESILELLKTAPLTEGWICEVLVADIQELYRQLSDTE